MNPDVTMTLEEAVNETLGLLTGMDLTYTSQHDRFRVVTRALNRALRANALEREWSYYSDIEEIGIARAGVQDVSLRASVRPRIIGDDSVRLVDNNGTPRVWAYILPRDAIEKYPGRRGLWASVSRQSLHFSRPFNLVEEGLRIQVPVMREPKMFTLPSHPSDDSAPLVPFLPEVLEQPVDFDYPDLIVMKAAFYIAQADPLMQPRVPTLDEQYKNLFYALNERDDRHTDSPFMNEFTVPIQSGIHEISSWDTLHPHSDERR